MASTYSPNLRIELIGNGEQSNTWGTTTNTNLGTLIEQAISGLVSVDVTAGNVTLTSLNGASDQSRQMIIVATGTPGVTRTITAPAVNKVYIVYNNSNATLSFIASGGTGVSLSVGAKKLIYCDGTNFVEAINSVAITSGSINGTTIGATTASTGAFTTLSASSTVSGTGFSTYLASPPAIGGTTAAAGKFTTLEYTGTLTGGTGVIAIGTNQIYKDASGNVGIGVTDFSATGANAKFAISLGGINLDDAKALSWGGGSARPYITASKSSAYLAMGVSGTERMRIDSSGNVGIGTTAPNNKLTVGIPNGTVGAGTVASFSGANVIASNTSGMVVITSTDSIAANIGGSIGFAANGTVAGYPTGSIAGRRENATAGDYSSYMQFTTSSSGGSVQEKMRIDSSGNVGIGLTSPTGKLDVAGTIKTLGYTVTTLPIGVVGARAYVTDALTPVFGATVVTGGAVTIPVFYNGTNWIVG